jgi:hypothetical protein
MNREKLEQAIWRALRAGLTGEQIVNLAKGTTAES